MFLARSRYSKIFVLLTAVFLLFVATGGEYLHNHIHHHATQASHQECSFYQLQVQIFTALVALIIALLFRLSFYVVKTYQVFIFPSYHNLPNLRAPPLSLA